MRVLVHSVKLACTIGWAWGPDEKLFHLGAFREEREYITASPGTCWDPQKKLE